MWWCRLQKFTRVENFSWFQEKVEQHLAENTGNFRWHVPTIPFLRWRAISASLLTSSVYLYCVFFLYYLMKLIKLLSLSSKKKNDLRSKIHFAISNLHILQYPIYTFWEMTINSCHVHISSHVKFRRSYCTHRNRNTHNANFHKFLKELHNKNM